MVIVFCVFKQGVYRHDCIGVFTTEELAKKAAQRAAELDKDNYHTYQVVPKRLDDWTFNDDDRVLYACEKCKVCSFIEVEPKNQFNRDRLIEEPKPNAELPGVVSETHSGDGTLPTNV